MQNKVSTKLKVVKSNTKLVRVGKCLTQDKRYVKRNSKGQFDEIVSPPSVNNSKSSKADEMLGRAWKNTYENRNRRVG